MAGITPQDIDQLVRAFEEQRARLRAVATSNGIDLDLGESATELKEKLMTLTERPESLDDSGALRLRTTSERLEKIEKLQNRASRRFESSEWPAPEAIQKAIDELSEVSEVDSEAEM